PLLPPPRRQLATRLQARRERASVVLPGPAVARQLAPTASSPHLPPTPCPPASPPIPRDSQLRRSAATPPAAGRRRTAPVSSLLAGRRQATVRRLRGSSQRAVCRSPRRATHSPAATAVRPERPCVDPPEIPPASPVWLPMVPRSLLLALAA